MRKTALIISTVLMITLFVFACARMQETFDEVVFEPLAVSSGTFREKALKYEKNGELQLALLNWKIVLKITPGDRDAEEKVNALISLTETKAGEHFRRGLTYYEKQAFEAAIREFLTALRYNPDYNEPLDYVKNKINDRTHTAHEVKTGDTLENVARKVYGDPGKDFLIAYFNDLSSDAEPTPGTMLRLPLLKAESRGKISTEKMVEAVAEEEIKAINIQKETEPAEKEEKLPEKKKEKADKKKDKADKKKKAARKAAEAAEKKKAEKSAEAAEKKKAEKAAEAAEKEETEKSAEAAEKEEAEKSAEIKNELAKARGFLQSGQYEKVLSLVGKIIEKDSANTGARELRKAAYYYMGKNLIQQEKYPESLKVLKKAGSEYKDAGELISEIRARMRKKAEIHYRRGVRHFINELLPRAIAEWKKTLSLNPDHRKAKEDIRKARELMEKKDQ